MWIRPPNALEWSLALVSTARAVGHGKDTVQNKLIKLNGRLSQSWPIK